MNRTARLALTGGLALTAALTLGAAAFGDEIPATDGAAGYVTVQSPVPGDRNCPWQDGSATPPPAEAPAPSASAL